MFAEQAAHAAISIPEWAYWSTLDSHLVNIKTIISKNTLQTFWSISAQQLNSIICVTPRCQSQHDMSWTYNVLFQYNTPARNSRVDDPLQLHPCGRLTECLNPRFCDVDTVDIATLNLYCLFRFECRLLTRVELPLTSER